MRKKRFKKFRNNVYYICASVIIPFIRILPRKFGLILFSFLGNIAYYLLKKTRNRTKEHLSFIFGEKWDNRKIEKTAHAVFCETGKNIFDAAYLTSKSDKVFFKHINCINLDKIKESYNKKKGIIAVTAHIGCFELMLNFFGRSGIESFAIGSKLYDSRMEKFIKEIRSGPNITYIHRSRNNRKIFRMLNSGKVLGVLIDQDTKVEGVFSHFLGHLAHTPSTSVKIAMRYNIPVFVATITRQKNEKHLFELKGPIILEKTDNEDRDLTLNLEKINSIISEIILRNPEQWVWMHKRWKKKPEKHKNIPNIDNYI